MPPDAFVEWELPLDFSLPRDDLDGMSLQELADVPFEELGRFKQAQSFPHGYSTEYLTFYAPRDTGVHEVLLWAILQARSSIAINMYGFTDPQVVALLQHHAESPHMVVTLSLDSTQAGGKSEKALLERLRNDLPGNSIAVGRSERGDISHDKLMVIDGLFLVTGSTNWSFRAYCFWRKVTAWPIPRARSLSRALAAGVPRLARGVVAIAPKTLGVAAVG